MAPTIDVAAPSPQPQPQAVAVTHLTKPSKHSHSATQKSSKIEFKAWRKARKELPSFFDDAAGNRWGKTAYKVISIIVCCSAALMVVFLVIHSIFESQLYGRCAHDSSHPNRHGSSCKTIESLNNVVPYVTYALVLTTGISVVLFGKVTNSSIAGQALMYSGGGFVAFSGILGIYAAHLRTKLHANCGRKSDYLLDECTSLRNATNGWINWSAHTFVRSSVVAVAGVFLALLKA